MDLPASPESLRQAWHTWRCQPEETARSTVSREARCPLQQNLRHWRNLVAWRHTESQIALRFQDKQRRAQVCLAMHWWRSGCDTAKMPARLRFKLIGKAVQGSFAANTISSRIYLDMDQLYLEAANSRVDEGHWELFLRERMHRKIEEHRFIATCMEIKVLKSINYPHSRLNVSNEELYARACIDRVPENEWGGFIENALGMALGKYSGVWCQNGTWDISRKELENAQKTAPMLIHTRIHSAFTGVAAGVRAEASLLNQASERHAAAFRSYRIAARYGSGYMNCTKCGQGNTHVLFLHGYGTGLAIWAETMAGLPSEFTSHALDLPGFGCSSHLEYKGDDLESALRYFTEPVADWQTANELDKVAIVGHSFGAYVAAHYCSQNPGRVSQLILVEPWGLFKEPQGAVISFSQLVRFLRKIKEPMKFARAAGPWGPSGLFYVPPGIGDFQDFFSPATSEFCKLWESDNPNTSLEVRTYLEQCLQYKTGPGEKAFQVLARTSQLWAKEPIECAHLLWPAHTCLVFGERSWMERATLHMFVQQDESRRVHIVPDAGHHPYLAKEFFKPVILEELCLSKPQRLGSYRNQHL